MTSRLDNFTLGRTLGSGFSAKVKIGVAPDGSEFALKIFDLNDPNFNKRAFKLLREEVAATTQLNHENVVRYHEFNENSTIQKANGRSKNVAYIVQEMISGGELFDYVANSGAFSEDVCRFYFKQMLMGIHYIHSHGFSHRDLKPENILLDKNYNIKIVDFGFACPLEGRDGSGINHSRVGTLGYMAPEIIRKDPYQGQVVDLFALAIILFIMRAGHPPFEKASDEDRHFQLLASNRTDLFWKAHIQAGSKGDSYFSEEFKDLISSMLQYHAHQRLCIADIVGHPWLTEGEAATQERIRAEFGNRHEINKARSKAEKAAKEVAKNKAMSRRRAVRVGGKVYLSHGDDVEISEDAADVELVSLQLKEYAADSAQPYSFFTSYKPDLVMQELMNKMNEQGQSYEMSNNTWKLNFEAIKTAEPTESSNEDGAENEGAQAMPQFLDSCRASVEILKVPGEDEKYCVNFSRKGGSSMLYYDLANKYMDLLEICNNASLEGEE